jgi:formamidopyrimidine-DNA glycosylase
MPELPEVELVRRRLESGVLNERISKVIVLDQKRIEGTDAEGLVCRLEGREFVRAGRIGKQLFLEMERGALMIHLGLTGDVVVDHVCDAAPRFARLVVEFEDGRRMVFEDMRRFGRVGFTDDIREVVMRKRLGPDVMRVSSTAFIERVGGHRRAIKTVLLDQSVVAGIGNLYADEALFQAGIHPLTHPSVLGNDELKRLWRDVRRVMRRSLAVGSDFDALPRMYLLRNRRAGERCPGVHGARLESMVVGGRTTVFCPAKQRIRKGVR